MYCKIHYILYVYYIYLFLIIKKYFLKQFKYFKIIVEQNEASYDLSLLLLEYYVLLNIFICNM